jgi:hypothetical protein
MTKGVRGTEPCYALRQHPPSRKTRMKIHPAGYAPSRFGPADWFTGRERMDPLFNPDAPDRVQGGPLHTIRPGDVVTFAPGERHWHGTRDSHVPHRPPRGHERPQRRLDGARQRRRLRGRPAGSDRLTKEHRPTVRHASTPRLPSSAWGGDGGGGLQSGITRPGPRARTSV